MGWGCWPARDSSYHKHMHSYIHDMGEFKGHGACPINRTKLWSDVKPMPLLLTSCSHVAGCMYFISAYPEDMIFGHV